MKRWTKALAVAAVFALPLLTAGYANADEWQGHGRGHGPGYGFSAGYCQGGGCARIEIRTDRARPGCDLRGFRHDRREFRRHRWESGRGHWRGPAYGRGQFDNHGYGYGRR